MIRIAVVEDEGSYQRQMEQYLERYQQEHDVRFQVAVFSDGVSMAYQYHPDFDLIFMDIELGAVNGMEVAEQIRKRDGEVVIIFVTNMPQYAMRGYAVEAMDYVLKPLSYYAFAQRMDRALERMRRRGRQYITVSTGKGSLQKLEVGEIRYVEVQEHTLIYHMGGEKLAVSGSMRETERKLEGKGFFRCNKGYLVNLDFVDGIQEEDAIVDGERVQISRAKKKAFLDALNNRMNEVSK